MKGINVVATKIESNHPSQTEYHHGIPLYNNPVERFKLEIIGMNVNHWEVQWNENYAEEC